MSHHDEFDDDEGDEPGLRGLPDFLQPEPAPALPFLPPSGKLELSTAEPPPPEGIEPSDGTFADFAAKVMTWAAKNHPGDEQKAARVMLRVAREKGLLDAGMQLSAAPPAPKLNLDGALGETINAAVGAHVEALVKWHALRDAAQRFRREKEALAQLEAKAAESMAELRRQAAETQAEVEHLKTDLAVMAERQAALDERVSDSVAAAASSSASRPPKKLKVVRDADGLIASVEAVK